MDYWPGTVSFIYRTMIGEPLYHASLASEEYEELLESNRFQVEAHVVEDPDCGGHTIWLARAILA